MNAAPTEEPIGGADGAGNRPIVAAMAMPAHLPPDGGPQNRFNEHYAVKVLDFGLAKAMEPASATRANAMISPTLSMHACN